MNCLQFFIYDICGFINKILHVGSYPGYFSWFRVSLRSAEKCGSCEGRNFGFPLSWHTAYTTACCYRRSRDDSQRGLMSDDYTRIRFLTHVVLADKTDVLRGAELSHDDDLMTEG